MKLNANIASMKPYVAGRTIPGAVKLSSNENPLGPSPKAIRAVKDALSGIHRYPDGATTALKIALAREWKIQKDSIMVASGSDEVFMLLAAAWIAPGENAVSAKETFSQYRYAVRLFGATMQELPLCDGHFDLTRMIEAIDDHTRMVFLCNPNNPTGTCHSHGKIKQFLENVPPNVIVILDEAYAEFADWSDFPDSRALLEQYPHLIVTRTFSKIYGLAGLRIGYAIGSPEIISGAERASMPFNVNNLAQVAALASLEDETHKQKTLELVHREKHFLSSELSKRKIFHYPTQANFICFHLEKRIADLWDAIAHRGIALRDLRSFGLPKMARYTLGTRANNLRLIEILDEVTNR